MPQVAILVLSDRTRGLVGQRELALMKPTAYLITTSRGPIVDEAALITALTRGRIAGAGLDVFDIEPLPAVLAWLAERRSASPILKSCNGSPGRYSTVTRTSATGDS